MRADWLQQLYEFLLPHRAATISLPEISTLAPDEAVGDRTAALAIDEFVGMLNALPWLRADLDLTTESPSLLGFGIAYYPKTRWDYGVRSEHFQVSSDLVVESRQARSFGFDPTTYRGLVQYFETLVTKSSFFVTLREVCTALEGAEAPLWLGERVAALVGADERRRVFSRLMEGHTRVEFQGDVPMERTTRARRGHARLAGIECAVEIRRARGRAFVVANLTGSTSPTAGRVESVRVALRQRSS